MKGISLGKSQKAVLYADIGHPEMTDSEISRIIGISPGRISTIRSQLVHNEFYHEIKIPSFTRLGYEGIGVVIAEPSNPQVTDSAHNKKILDELGRNPNVIFALESGGTLIFISAFPKLSSFEAFADDLFEVCCKIGESDCETTIASFPSDISKVHSFWDFGSLIHNHFTLNISTDKRPTSKLETSTTEKIDIDDLKILDLMLKNPIANDVVLAKIAGVSLSTFRRIKERIINNGYCRRAFIPDISKLGLELCVYSLLRLNPSRSKIGEVDHVRSLVDPWPFLLMARKSMAFIGHCFPDYTTYSQFTTKVLTELKRNAIHLEVIKMIPTPIANRRVIKPIDFSGVLVPLLENK